MSGDNSPSVSRNTITHPSQKPSEAEIQGIQRSNKVLEDIRKNPGTSAYEISKRMKYSYTYTLRKVKDLLYCGLVWGREIVLDGRKIKKLYSVSDKGNYEADDFFENLEVSK